MKFKNLKNKIANMAGGEVLGNLNTNESPEQQRKIHERQETDNTPEELPPEKIVKKTEPNAEDVQTNIESVEGYKDVLKLLNVKEQLEVDVEFTSEDLDYVEFTQTQPIGFDFDEVTDFISRAKYSMHKLEAALKHREKDIVKIASEVKRIEQKMIDNNHAKELERMIGGMTEEEKLIQENMELKVEINELKTRLKGDMRNSKLIKDLNKQIEILQSENKILKMNKSLPYETEKTNNEDMFDDMLDEIGGLYNE